MHKVFKPIIALSVLTAFTLSTVLCCCAMQMVYTPFVKSMSAMASDPCQKDSSSQKKSHHGYCFLQAPAADKVQLASVIVPSLYSVSYNPKTLVVIQHYIHQISSVRTAYGGILFSRAGPIPLYFLNRSIRI